MLVHVVLSSFFIIDFDNISSILDYHKATIQSYNLCMSFGETNTIGKNSLLDLLDILRISFLVLLCILQVAVLFTIYIVHRCVLRCSRASSLATLVE